MITPLAEALDGERFGGKAVQLGTAIRGGLPVPSGYALSADVVEAVADGASTAIAAVERVSDELGLLAVRSSALDEDSADASFAGAHLSVLAVSGRAATVDAVGAVRASGQLAGAQEYRARLGLELTSRMAVVIQTMVDAEMAGVLFTRNPVTGADERVIEASWGLGEAVVSGLVTPDRYRVSRGGRELERNLGEKDLAIRPRADADAAGPTEEVPVGPDLSDAFCLGEAELAALDALASRCDDVYESTDHDIEFAFRGGEIFLLQRRPITRV
ncbi:MAG TPA: PEP/pyruvate-binding domain-containing protein [Nocardioides sp.]|nr:PEP/pyruvate-binding domain-containing protein [Nocardioides sp.]